MCMRLSLFNPNGTCGLGVLRCYFFLKSLLFVLNSSFMFLCLLAHLSFFWRIQKLVFLLILLSLFCSQCFCPYKFCIKGIFKVRQRTLFQNLHSMPLFYFWRKFQQTKHFEPSDLRLNVLQSFKPFVTRFMSIARFMFTG